MNTPQADKSIVFEAYSARLDEISKLEGKDRLDSVIELADKLRNCRAHVEEFRSKIYSALEKKKLETADGMHEDAAVLLAKACEWNHRRMEYELLCERIQKLIISHIK